MLVTVKRETVVSRLSHNCLGDPKVRLDVEQHGPAVAGVGPHVMGDITYPVR